MSWFRRWIPLCVAALGILCASAANSSGQTVLGRGLGLHKCAYRVYYRSCEGCWRVYATYLDCRSAEEAVGFLQATGSEAYQAPVWPK
jgi:hypothetical protein